MRWLALTFLPLVLIACSDEAPTPTPTRQVNPCIAAFQVYDRALFINLGSLFRDLTPGSPSVRDEEALRAAEAGIREKNCLTNSAAIPRIITPRADMHRNRAGDSGQLGKTRYMHVAITTDRNGARNLEQFFAGLGYSVRVASAGRLGWRVFLGPLRSNGAVYHAQTLMDQVGVDTAYVINSGQ